MSSTERNHTRNSIQRTIYNGVILPVMYGALSVVSAFHPKLRETFRGRRNVLKRFWQASDKLSERPLWFHVSSVGEYEQAKPVIDALSRDFPDLPVVLTFSSPSGFNFAAKKETEPNNIEFIDYLPVDFASNARVCIEALNPRLIVFVKFDLWPNLIWEAAKLGVPSILIDATLSENSYRFTTGVGRSFYRDVYAHLRRILAISETDAGRFSRCVPEHNGIAVTGDTRFDRVMDRKRARNGSSFQIDTKDRLVVLAGSTWPRDETHMLDALTRVARTRDDLLFIIAPHEPSPERVDELVNWGRSAGIETTTLSHSGGLNGSGSNHAIVIDSVGVLAEAYELAHVAYVGGGFSTGVHSVIEPAIMGIPVIFGPEHRNSFEALELLRHHAAETIANADDAVAHLTKLLDNEDVRHDMGSRARSYVESQLGATERCMNAIHDFIK